MNVAAAVEEQSATTDGIAKSAETLRATVQSDANMISQLTSEAEELSEAAAAMEQSVSAFK